MTGSFVPLKDKDAIALTTCDDAGGGRDRTSAEGLVGADVEDAGDGRGGQHLAPKLWQKVLYGLGASYGFNALVVANGTLLDFYEEVYEVDTAFLGLATFFAGILTVFALVTFGYVSDATRSRLGRRKPYILGLTPVLSISLTMLYSPSMARGRTSVHLWFAATYTLMQVSMSALMVIIAAWGTSFTRAGEERCSLYTIDALLDLLGYLTGVLITVVDKGKYAGAILAMLFIVQNTLFVTILPTDSTPEDEGSDTVPFIPGLHLSMQNRQFVMLLWATTFGSIVCTTVNLLPVFLHVVMQVPEQEVDDVYSLFVRWVVCSSLFTIVLMHYLNRRFGKLLVLKIGVIAGMVYGLMAFWFSYASVGLFYLSAIPAGVMGGVVMINGNVILSNTIDYDELITGYRRQSTYQCLITVPVTLIGVAGSSIPLSIISAVGQTQRVDSGPMSSSTVTILRLWVSLVVSICLMFTFVFLSRVEITDDVHEEIVKQLQRREKGETSPPMDPLAGSMQQGSRAGVVPLQWAQRGEFLELYFTNSEMQLAAAEEEGKQYILGLYALDLLGFFSYSMVCVWKIFEAVLMDMTTSAEVYGSVFVLAAGTFAYHLCRLPAFSQIAQLTADELKSWARKSFARRGEERMLDRDPFSRVKATVSLHTILISAAIVAKVLKVW